MLVAVSPYHITTREAPAMAALLLAGRVVTVVPGPIEHGSGVRSVAERVPAYLAFMKSWAWTAPLWRAGLLAADVDGESAIRDMFDVSTRIGTDDKFTLLRPFLREGIYDQERAYLNALASDLLKGGPDPGISLPLVAGLDRFATRHAAIVARSHPTSVAQQAESRLGRSISTLALPVLVQGSAERLLHAREVLEDVLTPLRTAWDALAAPSLVDLGAGSASMLDAELKVTQTAAAYTSAFEERREDLLDDCAADDVRVVEGTVVVTSMTLPADAVLSSSVAAVENLAGKPRRGPAVAAAAGPRSARREAPVATVPAVYNRFEQARVFTLVVRPLGTSQGRR